MQPVKIGILGLGTVGSGVVQLLEEEAVFFQSKLGIPIEIAGICARSQKTLNKFTLPSTFKTKNPEELCTHPDIQIILELVGGYEAKNWVKLALKNKKHIITANKAMLAKYASELFPLAAKQNRFLLFEAAVGGGIPIIKTLQESLIANEIEGLACTINGTCNYILSQMGEKKLAYSTMLKEAQKLGYAEADPAFDVNGTDSAHKLALLASLCYWKYVDFEEMHVEGIENISLEDLVFAEEVGCKVKLLGVISSNGGLSASVYPALLKKNHQLASVDGVLNAVFLKTSAAGECLLTGAGAGKLPTASSVISDLVSICRFLQSKGQEVPSQEIFLPENKVKLASIDKLQTEFYLRLTTLDEPGVLAQITSILAKHKISINSIIQKSGENPERVTVIILTHKSFNKDISNAVSEIDKLKIISNPTKSLRFYN